jgi:spore coat polysaccharide biosynthesis protein SpsF
MKTGFLITARLKSTRLPLKALKDLNGKTVLERVIERAKQVKGIDEIVLCTSFNPQDRPLVAIAASNNILYFTGEEDDVLHRLFMAGKFYGLDHIINITADNPLFSIYHANLVADKIRTGDIADYVTVSGLPLGAAVTGIRYKAIQLICQIKTDVQTEIWGYYFNRPEIFNITNVQSSGRLNRPDLRLTLDYEEDYLLLNRIYASMPSGVVPDLHHVIDYLDSNRETATINQGCRQMDLDSHKKNKINELFMNQLDKILECKQKIYCEQ